VETEEVVEDELEIALRMSAEAYKQENTSRSIEDAELDQVLQLSLAEQQRYT